MTSCMAKKTKYKPGDIVGVVGERGTSKVRAILKEVNGALLETEIGGFRTWNLDELRFVRHSNAHTEMSEETRAKLKAGALLRWSKRRQRLAAENSNEPRA